MRTESPVGSGRRVSYVENVFDFGVTHVPNRNNSDYKIEARSQSMEDIYGLQYREDFSLARVTWHQLGEREETLLKSGAHPFLYYERRFPLIPDFPIAASEKAGLHREFIVAGASIIQDVRPLENGVQIVLRRSEMAGFLEVNMDWHSGDPWWSAITCVESLAPGTAFAGHVVASGKLIRTDSAK